MLLWVLQNLVFIYDIINNLEKFNRAKLVYDKSTWIYNNDYGNGVLCISHSIQGNNLVHSGQRTMHINHR